MTYVRCIKICFDKEKYRRGIGYTSRDLSDVKTYFHTTPKGQENKAGCIWVPISKITLSVCPIRTALISLIFPPNTPIRKHVI